MSGKLMGQVWDYKWKNGNELAVVLAMADHAQDDGTDCYPSVGKIAWKIGISERQVIRIMHKLTEQGVLEVVAQATRHKPTEYAIHLEAVPLKPSFVSKRSKAGKAAKAAIVSDVSRADTVSGQVRADTVSSLDDEVRADISEFRADISEFRADISEVRADIHMSAEPSCKPSNEPSFLAAAQPTLVEVEPNAPQHRTRNTATPKKEKAPPKPKSEAVKAYRDLAHWSPERAVEAEIDTTVTDLELWRNVVKTWLMRGKWKGNVEGMLDWYRNGIPDYSQNGNGHNGKGNGAAHPLGEGNGAQRPAPASMGQYVMRDGKRIKVYQEVVTHT